jgi:hypothetical protein
MSYDTTLQLCLKTIEYRGVRTGGLGPGEARPPSFAKCPFFRRKVPFSCVKNVIKIAFFAQRALLTTWIYVVSGNWFFFISGQNIIYPKNFFGMSENFFWDAPRKIFRCPFLIEKCPSNPAPPPTFRSFLRPW